MSCASMNAQISLTLTWSCFGLDTTAGEALVLGYLGRIFPNCFHRWRRCRSTGHHLKSTEGSHWKLERRKKVHHFKMINPSWCSPRPCSCCDQPVQEKQTSSNSENWRERTVRTRQFANRASSASLQALLQLLHLRISLACVSFWNVLSLGIFGSIWIDSWIHTDDSGLIKYGLMEIHLLHVATCVYARICLQFSILPLTCSCASNGRTGLMPTHWLIGSHGWSASQCPTLGGKPQLDRQISWISWTASSLAYFERTFSQTLATRWQSCCASLG